jgi:hypothetical protein
MDRATLRAALEQASRQSRRGPAAALTELGGYLATAAGKLFAPLGPHASFLGDAAAELFGTPGEAAEERRRRIERQLSDAERELDEFQLARRKVLRDLQGGVDVLEGRLPSSRLTGED